MPFPEISRRVFLKRSLQATASLALAPVAGGLAACGPGESAAEGRATFSPLEFRVLEAVTEAFFPALSDGGPLGTSALEVGLAARIDRELDGQDPDVISGFRAALWLLEYAGGPLAGRLGRFSRLAPADRSHVLARLPHRFALPREIYAGLKSVCVFYFYSLDESWGATGYDGPWVERELA